MNIAINVALLIAGFALLIKGADVFVDASSNIARRLRVPSVVIGLTIVSFGTSVPEAVVSISAALRGANGMAIGNAVGSNLFNILMVIGLGAAVKPILVNFRELSKDFWVSVVAAVVYLILLIVFRTEIPRIASIAVFAVFMGYIVVLVRQALKYRTPEHDDIEELKPMWHSFLFALLGVGGIVGGGQLAVMGAIEIASSLGMTERVIGLTVIAIGTSLPELVTSVVAVRKNESAIAVGNVIGSNIFNLMFVLGFSGMILPLAIDTGFLIDFALLLTVSFMFFLFVRTGKKISRVEGLIFVAIYFMYMSYTLIV